MANIANAEWSRELALLANGSWIRDRYATVGERLDWLSHLSSYRTADDLPARDRALIEKWRTGKAEP